MDILTVNGPLSDQARSEALFQGQLLVFKNIPAMQQLINYSDALLRQHLDGLTPPEAQHQLGPERFVDSTTEVQRIFRTSEEPKRLFFQALEQCGVDLSQSYYDHFPMRVVPFDNTHQGAHRAAIGHHRDSWGSNLHNQHNWWAPLYSLEAERTIAFYPDYWHQPIANNTDSWSFEEYLEQRRQGVPDRSIAYPSAPRPLQEVDESGVVKVVIAPGDILSFASAHLHASVPNTTQATRFSVEMRTLHRDDLQSGRSAPNVDNAATQPMYRWYRGVADRLPLEWGE